MYEVIFIVMPKQYIIILTQHTAYCGGHVDFCRMPKINMVQYFDIYW